MTEDLAWFIINFSLVGLRTITVYISWFFSRYVNSANFTDGIDS